MDYLYGKLNKLVELQKYKFISSDNTILTNEDNNTVDLSVNLSQLIMLKQVKKDASPLDDPIKYYALYGYNHLTDAFDIKLGDEIVVDNSTADDAASAVKTAFVKVGEEQKFDPVTGLPELDPDTGKPIMVPILKEVVVDVNKTGQLVLDQIPASAIVDKHTNQETGEEEIIQSILDGNTEGEVY